MSDTGLRGGTVLVSGAGRGLGRAAVAQHQVDFVLKIDGEVAQPVFLRLDAGTDSPLERQDAARGEKTSCRPDGRSPVAHAVRDISPRDDPALARRTSRSLSGGQGQPGLRWVVFVPPSEHPEGAKGVPS